MPQPRSIKIAHEACWLAGLSLYMKTVERCYEGQAGTGCSRQIQTAAATMQRPHKMQGSLAAHLEGLVDDKLHGPSVISEDRRCHLHLGAAGIVPENVLCQGIECAISPALRVAIILPAAAAGIHLCLCYQHPLIPAKNSSPQRTPFESSSTTIAEESPYACIRAASTLHACAALSLLVERPLTTPQSAVPPEPGLLPHRKGYCSKAKSVLCVYREPATMGRIPGAVKLPTF